MFKETKVQRCIQVFKLLGPLQIDSVADCLTKNNSDNVAQHVGITN